MRSVQIPQPVSQYLALRWRELSADQKQEVAKSIIEVSSHYQNREGLNTPWKNHELAYLFYFFPLNLARGCGLFESLKDLLPSAHENSFDLGAGLGNLEILQKIFPKSLLGKIYSIEKNQDSTPERLRLFEQLEISSPMSSQWSTSLPQTIPPNSLGFFSYSLVEMKTELNLLSKFDTLIFLEPSTSHVARKLMSLRSELLENNYLSVAPCTHNQNCPLLVHSKTDWCHDRVHFDPPSWFMELESFLPMKNSTLTYSYLAVSRIKRKVESEDFVRVIGDTLKEKGKTRQAICFDDQRRFLSWLKRDHKEPDRIDHGSLIKIENPEEKGSELRVKDFTRILKL